MSVTDNDADVMDEAALRDRRRRDHGHGRGQCPPREAHIEPTRLR